MPRRPDKTSTSTQRKKSARPVGVTFADVREIVLSMPDVIKTTAYGMPAFKAGKRRFAGKPVERPDVEPNSLGVHISFEERDRLMAMRPDVYYLTDHFRPYPAVLVRLSSVSRTDLRDLLGAAWHYAMEGSSRGKKKRRGTFATR